jgi:ferredoxin
VGTARTADAVGGIWRRSPRHNVGPQKGDAKRLLWTDPSSRRAPSTEVRSNERICRSSLGVKAWQAEMPSASTVRPARCPGCGAASRPTGQNLVVHGDGTRERQVRGPATPEGPPVMTTVRARRYQCQRCGACMVVVPREIMPRRLYTACAIGLALAMWALLGATEAAVRTRISPFAVVGATACGGWITLRRCSRGATSCRGPRGP